MQLTSYATSISEVQSARALGWASLGIGLLEVAAPSVVQSMLGLEDRAKHRGVLRVLGLRELMHGASILTVKRANAKMARSVWSRVAGDMLDTAVLGMAATKTKHPARFATVAAMVAGIGLLDLACSMRLERRLQ